MTPGTELQGSGAAVPESEQPLISGVDPSVVGPGDAAGPRPGIALCLSGGGSRAMLFHAGAILRLAEADLLKDVLCVSSVSGGSIASGRLARCWVDARGTPSAAQVRAGVVDPLVAVTRRYIDVPAFLRGLLPGRSPGGEFAKALDRHLLGGLTLGALPDSPEFVFNATNLNTGVLWRFSKAFVGDYVVDGGPDPSIRVSTAVAASSAFPPFFAPLTLRRPALAGGMAAPGAPSAARAMASASSTVQRAGSMRRCASPQAGRRRPRPTLAGVGACVSPAASRPSASNTHASAASATSRR
jgi:predicted acylesterase/phospholipase RssA